MTTHTTSHDAAAALANGGMQILPSGVLAAAILATGLMAGVFGLYTHTITPGLRHTDDRTFIGAFQSMDRAIMNHGFMMALSIDWNAPMKVRSSVCRSPGVIVCV